MADRLQVSVVMSAYNPGLKVRETIESVLRQNFADFEFIALDDASTDGTLAVLEEYARADARIRVLSNRSNVGLTRNLIRGVEAARGRYIARIDAGDTWLPEKLAVQWDFLEKNPDYVLCASQVNFIMGGQPLGPSDFATRDDELRKRLFTRKGLLSHSTILFRNILNYRPQFRYSQDLDLYARLAFLGKMHCLPQHLVIFEVGDAGITMDSKFLQRQYQGHGYRLFLQRYRSGCDELDVQPECRLPVRDSLFEKRWCDLGIFFFRRFIKYKVRRSPAPKWLGLFLFSLLAYPPFLKDYALRLYLLKKFRKNPWKTLVAAKPVQLAGAPFPPPQPADAGAPPPQVSVVMSVHDSKTKIRKSVETVLAQTFGDFEFIILDDASTDGTREILEAYARADARIRLFFSPSNAGLTRNLMRGIDAAKGRYVARIDAGDYWVANKLELQWDFMEARPDHVLCGSQVNFITAGRLLGPSDYATEDGDLRMRLFTREGLLSHPTIFFRRGLNYRAPFRYSQDLDLYARLAFAGKMYCLPEHLVFCEIGTSGITVNRKALQRQFQGHGYRLFLERFRKGTDELDQHPERPLPIRQSAFEVGLCAFSMSFFRLFTLYKLQRRPAPLWLLFFAASLAFYPPFLKDYAVRFLLIRKYRRNPWEKPPSSPMPA